MNEIKENIRKYYLTFLDREPDSIGLEHYFKLIRDGKLKIQDLEEVFKNSDEYKKISMSKKWNEKNPYIISGKGDLFYKISSGSVIDNIIEERGMYDEAILNSLTGIVPKNGIILDIGANVGGLTLPFAKICVPSGTVFAFEPDIEVREQLLENIKINKLKNIIVNPIALQDSLKTKLVTLFKRRAIHDDGRTNKGLSTIEKNPTYIQAEEIVKADTIDNFVSEKDIAKINVIKIDVEGADYKVLLGGKNTIEKDLPIIIYEFSPIIDDIIRENNTKKCYEFLEKIGYIQIQILFSNKNKILHEYSKNITESDILCIHKSKMKEHKIEKFE